MSQRERGILAVLQDGSSSAGYLADRFGCPTASIRRSIGTLRKAGHDISYANDEGIYRYWGVIGNHVS